MTREHQRIRYGEETDEEPWYLAPAFEESPCHDCGAEPTEFHDPGCDIEQCPICRQQLISCEHWDEVMA